MSDATDLILEGIICMSCSEIMDDEEAAGYPRECYFCKEGEEE